MLIIKETQIFGMLINIIVKGISSKNVFPYVSNRGFALYPVERFPKTVNIMNIIGHKIIIRIMKFKFDIKLA